MLACLFLSGTAYAWDLNITRTPTDNPIITCVGTPVTIDLTASVTGAEPEEKAECAVGEKTYNWSGDATGTASTAKVTKTFNTAGQQTISATVEVTFANGIECGTPDTKTDTETVTVCVVDPGTAPNSVNGVNYIEHQVAPTGTAWGAVTPTMTVGVDITPYFDCTSKTWKCKVTTANTDYDIFYRLLPGVTEASIDAAVECMNAPPPNTCSYCEIIEDLATLTRTSPGWFMVEAVEEHERVHVQEYKDIVNPLFATAKATIEGLSVPHTCGKTAAQAATEIKALAAYTQAVNTLNADIATAWQDPAYQDPNPTLEAAEHSVVDGMVNLLRLYGAENGWPACP
jgi:hypothetical protein